MSLLRQSSAAYDRRRRPGRSTAEILVELASSGRYALGRRADARATIARLEARRRRAAERDSGRAPTPRGWPPAPADFSTRAEAASWSASPAMRVRPPRRSPRGRGTSCTSCRSRTGTGRCGRPWAARAAPVLTFCASAAVAAGRAVAPPRRLGAAPPRASLGRRSSLALVGDAALDHLALLLPAAPGRLCLLALDLHAEQLLDDVLLDAVHHLGEQVEAVLLVLLLRILLAVARRPMPSRRCIHRLQVLDPLLVDLLEVEVALEVHQPRARSAPSRARRAASRSPATTCVGDLVGACPCVRARTRCRTARCSASSSSSQSHSSSACSSAGQRFSMTAADAARRRGRRGARAAGSATRRPRARRSRAAPRASPSKRFSTSSSAPNCRQTSARSMRQPAARVADRSSPRRRLVALAAPAPRARRRSSSASFGSSSPASAPRPSSRRSIGDRLGHVARLLLVLGQARGGSGPRGSAGAARRSSCAAGSSRRRTRGRSCADRSCALRPSSARSRSSASPSATRSARPPRCRGAP